MKADTYTITFKCPKCKKPLRFEKKRNGVSPQDMRLRTFDNHRKSGECAA